MEVSEIPLPEEIYTPKPTPTPIIATVADLNPYEVLPLPKLPGNRTSMLKGDDANFRQVLNTTFTGSADLGRYAA